MLILTCMHVLHDMLHRTDAKMALCEETRKGRTLLLRSDAPRRRGSIAWEAAGAEAHPAPRPARPLPQKATALTRARWTRWPRRDLQGCRSAACGPVSSPDGLGLVLCGHHPAGPPAPTGSGCRVHSGGITLAMVAIASTRARISKA